jgi:hypothetical protein
MTAPGQIVTKLRLTGSDLSLSYTAAAVIRGHIAPMKSKAFRRKSRCHERDVRFGSKADIEALPSHVRFTPKSGHWNSFSKCPLCAKSRHSALRQRLALFDHLDGGD